MSWDCGQGDQGLQGYEVVKRDGRGMGGSQGYEVVERDGRGMGGFQGYEVVAGDGRGMGVDLVLCVGNKYRVDGELVINNTDGELERGEKFAVRFSRHKFMETG